MKETIGNKRKHEKVTYFTYEFQGKFLQEVIFKLKSEE